MEIYKELIMGISNSNLLIMMIQINVQKSLKKKWKYQNDLVKIHLNLFWQFSEIF